MEIRNACLGDVRTVYGLICELEAKALDEATFIRLYEQGLGDSSVHYLLAEEPVASAGGNQTAELSGTPVTVPIGFMSIQVRPFLHRAGTVTEVMELIVPALARGRGVGQRLFDRALEIARSNGSVQLELCSNVLRTRAHEFYERNGMKKYHYKLTLPMHITGEDLNIIGR